MIIFPAGEVSRAGAKGIRDRNWLPGFIQLAKSTRSPVLPVHIKARNSALFYAVSRLSQPLSMLMLPREMLGFKGKIKFTIGQPIAPGVIEDCHCPVKNKPGLSAPICGVLGLVKRRYLQPSHSSSTSLTGRSFRLN